MHHWCDRFSSCWGRTSTFLARMFRFSTLIKHRKSLKFYLFKFESIFLVEIAKGREASHIYYCHRRTFVHEKAYLLILIPVLFSKFYCKTLHSIINKLLVRKKINLSFCFIWYEINCTNLCHTEIKTSHCSCHKEIYIYDDVDNESHLFDRMTSKNTSRIDKLCAINKKNNRSSTSAHTHFYIERLTLILRWMNGDVCFWNSVG